MRIIDGHIRLGESFNGKHGSAETYLNLMDQLSIGKAVVCPNKPASYRVEDGNRAVAEVIAERGNRFVGALRMDPWRWEEMKKEWHRYRDSGFFRFFYLHPFEDQFRCNGKEVEPILTLAEEEGLPVIVETGYPWTSHITQVVDVARRHPKLTFLATNAGQLDLSASTMEDAALALDKAGNLMMGTAGACGAEWIAGLAQRHPGRIFFESGFPMMEPYLEKFRIDHGFFGEREKEEVFFRAMEAVIK